MSRIPKDFIYALILLVFVTLMTVYLSKWYLKSSGTTLMKEHRSWKSSMSIEEKLEMIEEEHLFPNIKIKKDPPKKGDNSHEITMLWRQANFTHDGILYLFKEVGRLTKQIEELTTIISKQHGIVPDDPNSIDKLTSQIAGKKLGKNFDLKLDIIEKNAHELSVLPTKPINGEKIVHLDLKGAAPRMSYLLQFMAEAKKYGACGFLIEYEDMFPWSEGLSFAKRKTAYTKENIHQIVQKASSLGMKVIPLIQTYGHLEFVLKHDIMRELRSTNDDNRSINPTRKESLHLITTMIDQVLDLHPDIKWFHVGGDEVYNLEDCAGCGELKMTSAEKYLHHMIPILKYIKTKVNSKGESITPIIWDDMFRKWKVEDISQIKQYAVPMIWAYVDNLSNSGPFPHDMWARYVQSFESVFFASAFKGASKINSDLMDVEFHAKNNLEWLRIATLLESVGIKIEGIALTGWSRFSHQTALCELLPVGTPSLALCLEVLTVGAYDHTVVERVSRKLGVHSLVGQNEILKKPENFNISREGNFLGSDVIPLVKRLLKTEALIKTINPYGSSYVENSNKILGYDVELKQITKEVGETFQKYFYKDTIDEWIKTKVDKQSSELEKTNELIGNIKKNDKTRDALF